MLFLKTCRPFYYIFTQNIKRNLTTRNFNNLFSKPQSCLIYTPRNSSTPLVQSLRFYAKGRDKNKKNGKKKVEIDELQLAEVLDVEQLRTQMNKAVQTLKDEYIKSLSLRSTTGAIEQLQVNYEGKEYTLQELAQIVRKNPNSIIINMSTFPQAIPTVLKTIAKSGMNLNPQQDGTTLYLPVPKVTKEHRVSLAKNAKTLFVKCKDRIRETQLKYTKSVKKQENLATDLVHMVQDQIEVIGNQYIGEAEKILQAKQAELIGKE